MAKITIETDDISEARSLLDALETRTDTPSATPTQAIQTAPEAREDPNVTADAPDLDSNGMSWDAEIHTSTKTMNTDGSWKAARGKAEEAKAAVAAFKAGGGNVTATATTGMPTGMPAAGGMPGATPAGETRDMAPPVTQAALEEKIIGMMGRGQLAQDKYAELLTKHGIDLSDPSAVLSTNETLRAALYADCCEIEPEAP